MTFDLVPRTFEDQAQWIAEHSGGHPAIVAVDDRDEVHGFRRCRPFGPGPPTPTVEDSVYVQRDDHGRGIGELLLRDLLGPATDHGFHPLVVARIVGGHDASIALHERCGFEQVGCEREVGRKFGRWLDVVLMQRML